MRVLFAGLFVCIGLGLFVALIGAVLEHVSPLWRGPIGIGIAMVALLLIAAALVLFNSFTRSSNSTPTASDDESAAQLERDNLLSSTRFQATRAFQVPEFEDEGPHYFIELVGGAVLYLNGQYLHDYEPDEFTSETTGSETDAEPRTEFPCTDFTVRRHRVEGYVVDIQCAGSGLQPTPIERDFFQADGYANDYPTDGDVITDTSYDELRARFAART